MCVWCSISALTSVTLIRLLDRFAWHIQPFLSLLHAHRRFIGGKKLGYICSSTFALTRQLTSVNYSSPESNTFSQCQVISLFSYSCGENQDCHIQPPTTPPTKLASHCGKSAVPSICSCYPSNQSLVAKVQVPPYEHVSQSIMTYFLLCLNWFIYIYLYILHILKKKNI